MKLKGVGARVTKKEKLQRTSMRMLWLQFEAKRNETTVNAKVVWKREIS